MQDRANSCKLFFDLHTYTYTYTTGVQTHTHPMHSCMHACKLNKSNNFGLNNFPLLKNFCEWTKGQSHASLCGRGSSLLACRLPAYAHLLSLFFLLFYFSCSSFKSLSDQLGNNEISLSSGSQGWPLCGLFGAWLPPSRKNRLLTSLCGVTQDVISPVNGSLNCCPATRDLEKESLFVGVLVISTALACLTMQVPGMSGPCQAWLRS